MTRCPSCLGLHVASGPCLGREALTSSALRAEAEAHFIGAQVGNYRVIRELGRGGMGTVYLGEHQSIGSKVAIKVLHPHLSSVPGLVMRFQAEARAVNLVGHANIIDIFDFGILPTGQHYLVMEHLDGRSLADLATRALPASEVVPLLLQVCDALEAAHRSGVVHRDLKPENIFLVRRGRVRDFIKVLDFGIAKLLSPTELHAQTAVGALIGTPEYMAPEQVRGEAVDGRTDLYALGIIAWQLLAGTLPFSGAGVADVLAAQLSEVPQPLHEANPLVPLALSQAVHAAMEKEPGRRHASAAAFAAALEAAGRTEAAFGSLTPRPQHAPAFAASPLPAPPPWLQSATPRPTPRTTPRVWMSSPQGPWQGPFEAAAISRGGLVVCHPGPMPGVGTNLRLKSPQLGELECAVEVVQHVTADRAQAWNLPIGYAVQFVGLDAGRRQQLQASLLGLSAQALTTQQEARVDEVLARHAPAGTDVYAVLGVARDAPLATLTARAQEALGALEALLTRGVPPSRLPLVAQARRRLIAAQVSVVSLEARAATDASLGNTPGLARGLDEGLAPQVVDGLRATWLAAHPAAEEQGRLRARAGQALERAQAWTEAREAWASALAADPLNVEFHRRLVWLSGKA